VEGGGQALDFIRRPVGAAADQVMFKVDIGTGEVLVDRLDEVLGSGFAAYSRTSAFGGGRPTSGKRGETKS